MKYKEKTWDYLPAFMTSLKLQLEEDEKHWGDTWKQRDVVGQEERIFKRIQDYRDQFEQAKVPVPWLKIAGLALIAWIRETGCHLSEGNSNENS